MKRAKDEDKSMGPMFPRLHVNDTDKGGPRAPPRNKMALYEQLSIPSQRFNGGSGVMPFNPNSTPNSIPPSSSTPGPFSPHQQSSSIHATRRTDARHSELNNQRVQQEHKRRQEDDDFRVPIFDQQSGTGTTQNRQNRENERVTQFSAPFSGRIANVHNARQSQKENSHDFARSASNQPLNQNPKVPLKETNESANFRDYRGDSQADNTLWGESGLNEASKASGYEHSSVPLMEVQQEASRSPNNGDAVSETSMVDSICGIDISPDDVVGIIGQKHFWKARRAIVNQQRVFAVQVFELHRLIKVQKLIAKSPQLLFEESAYLSKPQKATTIKRIPLEYVIKPKNQNDKNALEDKPNEDTEFSAENAPGKASLSSVQNGSQTTYCRPFSGNPVAVPPSPPPGDMGPWNYNQPPPGHGHQWLIPVMSPSEGLVYKPYPGPPSGFMNQVYGGPGPMMGHSYGNYGVPIPVPPPSDHHYETPTGVHPFAPPASHGYFPAYNMPPVNPTVNQPVNPMVNLPVKRTDSKHSEVQASTASSRSDRTHNRNALPLFPTSPPVAVAAAVPVTDPAASRVEVAEPEPPRVIRVVPHNARSATASVARIFRSIQEERKQCGD